MLYRYIFKISVLIIVVLITSCSDEKTNSRFVTVGNYTSSSGGRILTSVDGDSWNSSFWTSDFLQTVTYGGNLLVAAGGDNIWWLHDDAYDWEKGYIPMGCTIGCSGVINDITYGNNLFIIVGTYTDSGTSSNINAVWYSENASVWIESTSTTQTLYSITYGNDKYVGVGDDGTIYWSSDGKSWNIVTIGGVSDDFRGVAFGNNIFVAVGGTGGLTYKSTDGVSWTSNAAPNQLNNVTYGNNVFVAVGSSGIIYWSSDGASWSENVGPGNIDLNGVTYGNDRFLAVGNSGSVYWSSDGMNWSAYNATGYGNLNDIYYNEGILK